MRSFGHGLRVQTNMSCMRIRGITTGHLIIADCRSLLGHNSVKVLSFDFYSLSFFARASNASPTYTTLRSTQIHSLVCLFLFTPAATIIAMYLNPFCNSTASNFYFSFNWTFVYDYHCTYTKPVVQDKLAISLSDYTRRQDSQG